MLYIGYVLCVVFYCFCPGVLSSRSRDAFSCMNHWEGGSTEEVNPPNKAPRLAAGTTSGRLATSTRNRALVPSGHHKRNGPPVAPAQQYQQYQQYQQQQGPLMFSPAQYQQYQQHYQQEQQDQQVPPVFSPAQYQHYQADAPPTGTIYYYSVPQGSSHLIPAEAFGPAMPAPPTRVSVGCQTDGLVERPAVSEAPEATKTNGSANGSNAKVCAEEKKPLPDTSVQTNGNSEMPLVVALSPGNSSV